MISRLDGPQCRTIVPSQKHRLPSRPRSTVDDTRLPMSGLQLPMENPTRTRSSRPWVAPLRCLPSHGHTVAIPRIILTTRGYGTLIVATIRRKSLFTTTTGETQPSICPARPLPRRDRPPAIPTPDEHRPRSLSDHPLSAHPQTPPPVL